jgi:hypothetical protein
MVVVVAFAAVAFAETFPSAGAAFGNVVFERVAFAGFAVVGSAKTSAFA